MSRDQEPDSSPDAAGTTGFQSAASALTAVGLPSKAYLRRIDAEARERGFPSAQALRKWCERMGVVVYRTGKLAWVDPKAIEVVILRGTPQRPTAPRSTHAEIADGIAGLPRRTRRS